MNLTYRLAWHCVGRAAALGASLIALCPSTQAAPVGGVISSGSGAVTQAGNTTTITQASPTLSLNWQGFNIGAQEKVRFAQPSASAVAVNRIADINGTQILGRLDANGQVVLINPNGILFGQNAQVDVGGLVASTLDLNGSANGASRSFAGAGSGSVVNRGSIRAASGGYVALLGNHVSNQGSITARMGTVALGAGSAATLHFDGDSLVGLQIDRSVLNSLAENGGLIQADGGMVAMTAGAADSLLASVVNNSGIIEARTLDNHGGSITLLGGMAAGTARLGGTLDASAPDGGNGGLIETSAATVAIADNARADTRAAQGATGIWRIDPADFTIAAAGGNITGTALSASLATSNMLIDTVGTAGSGAGDIHVNDAVNWSSASTGAGPHTLTLNAAGSININAPLTWGVSGTPGNAATTGALAMNAGNAINVAAPVNAWWRAPLTMTTGPGQVNVVFDPEAEKFAGAVSFFSDAGAHPAAGANLLAINGHSYTVISDVTPKSGVGVPDDHSSTSLQGMQNNPGSYYALGSDLDASATSNWSGSVFTFKSIATFSGSFDGLGHIIHHLDNELPADHQGLFGTNTGTIRNVGVEDSIVGGNDYVGALAGVNRGTISNSYSSSSASGGQYVGALVGYNDGGVISRSAGIGQVGGTDHVGGLVGFNNLGVISNSYAEGSVDSYGDNAGGLVGTNNGTILASHAAGTVEAQGSDTGGLVGLNQSGGLISGSYATTQTSGHGDAGGLVGTNHGVIRNSYAAASVLGADDVGGLVGLNDGAIISSYAASGVIDVGLDGGAFLGSNHGGTITNSFYNSDKNPSLTGVGSAGGDLPDVAGAVWGMSTAAMQQLANFTTATGTAALTDHSGNGGVNPGWDIAANGAAVPATWTMTDGMSAPLIAAAMKPLTVTANSASKTYDGAAFAGNNGVTWSTTPDPGWLNGTLSYGGSAQGAVNAGVYAITPAGLYSTDQDGYLYRFVSGNLTIGRAAIIVGSSAVVKQYDGSTAASGSPVLVSGALYVNSANGNVPDALAGGVYTFASANALGAGNSSVNVAGVTVNDGNAGNNYQITYVPNTASTITPAPLTITSTSAISKTYDGTTAASGGSYAVQGTLFANASNGNARDTLAGGTFAFASADPMGAGKSTVNVAGVTVNDGNGGNNYRLSFAGNTASTITPAGAFTRSVDPFGPDQPSLASLPAPPPDRAQAPATAQVAAADSGSKAVVHEVSDVAAEIWSADGVADDSRRTVSVVAPALPAARLTHIGWQDAASFHSCDAPGHAASGNVTISLGKDGSFLQIQCAN